MDHIVIKQRQFFYTNKTKSYTFRKEQLEKLKQMLLTYENEIYEALYLDLNKSKHEALITEIGVIFSEIDFALKHLKNWMKREEVAAPLTHIGTKNYIMYEPFGVTFIVAPWNYPIQLALVPVIGAIAAGNTVILKPSELTPTCSNLLKEMIENTFDEQFFTVIEGDKIITEEIIAQKVDYIFFTGSTNVGKIIMEHASNHLTPVTLELGGKSPTIVDEDSNISLSAKRIAWGKFINAGQTCVAPDYVYVHEKVEEAFLKQLKKQIKKLYRKQPLDNDKYGKIINENHFNRLIKFIDQNKIIYGGNFNRDSLKIEPTILSSITWEDKIMEEEIFGPLLPVLLFQHIEDVVNEVNKRAKPLALYYFGKQNEQYVLHHTSSGGVCINDTLYHLANPHLPFGGVGHSGIGAYHGKYSFETFSHRKSVLKQTTSYDLPVRYPNYKLPHFIKEKIMK